MTKPSDADLIDSNSTSQQADDICPRMSAAPVTPTVPAAPAIYPATVWQCEDIQQASQLLSGEIDGYVYQRNRHPNSDTLAEKCRQLHQADHAAITSSGMSALALAMLTQTQNGGHILLSNQLYGASSQLIATEGSRLGISSTSVDFCDLDAINRAVTANTNMLVVETIANPRLRVANIAAIAEIAEKNSAALLVDNTFATPRLCQPLKRGAHLVMESLSKMMNGHSDVLLGLLVGRDSHWSQVEAARATWGLSSSPFDCYLAERGLTTMPLRVDRACSNALAVAEFLAERKDVVTVDYPGLANHPDHKIAQEQFGNRFGSIVTFELQGEQDRADKFIKAAKNIPFCPSLGESATTLSHPLSTSHRSLSEQQLKQIGITSNTIRLSIGIESPEFVIAAIEEAFA